MNNNAMEKKIRWGILGAGSIAGKFASDLRHVPHTELYAVGSRTQEKADDFARTFGIQRAYGSYERLASDKEVDVIYIATPHPMHCENTLLCLDHGKAVLCEKPFAMNEREVKRMIGKAQEKKLFLMEAMWSRFHPSVKKTIELIQSGVIGDIVHIKSDFGFRAPVNPDSRIYNPDLGGGSLLDVGVYPVYICLLLLGEPDEIISKALITDRGIDSCLSAIFKYNKGPLVNIFSSFITETATETEITGTKGSIKMHRKWFMPNPVTVELLDGYKETFTFECTGNGYEFEAMEVTKCLLENKTESPLMSHDFSLKLIRLLDTMRYQNKIFYKADKG
jgi:predicted dehydrogenase